MPKRRRTIRWALAGSLLALGLYLVAWPVPIDPVAWTPPAAPETTPNELLAGVERYACPPGPEDVAVDGEGRVYVGVLDGRILRCPAGGGDPEELAQTEGRPLGLAFDAQGRLLIADADRGLLRLDLDDRKLTTLATECEGRRFGFTDDLDVARDGTVYFSDASDRFGVADYELDLLEHGLNGRLLAWDPETQATRVVLDGLQFANGVAVSVDQRFVLVNETGKYRVTRLWLAGPKAGQHDVFVENLPGFPDGISARPDGGFWLALASPRDAILDAALPYPFARALIARLPKAVQPAPKRHAWVLGLSAEGEVTHDLQHAAPESFSPVTSVEERDGWLYLGSLTYPGYGRIKRPE
ncbi:MAG: SMP-30/gluconolactonase/LRE family protein [Planctomycetes bacterium]|nr:SMP-30/gluconolactonase/LRE family protein [Planctomycetota bacterium]